MNLGRPGCFSGHTLADFRSRPFSPIPLCPSASRVAHRQSCCTVLPVSWLARRIFSGESGHERSSKGSRGRRCHRVFPYGRTAYGTPSFDRLSRRSISFISNGLLVERRGRGRSSGVSTGGELSG